MGRCGRMDGTRRNSVGNQKVKHHKHRNIRRNCSVVWTWKDPFYTSKYKHHVVLSFRTLPGKHVDKIAEQMRMHNINALLIIGGFEVCFKLFLPVHHILLMRLHSHVRFP